MTPSKQTGPFDRAMAYLWILLIDDSASVREVLRVALESEGYRVLEAADGRELASAY